MGNGTYVLNVLFVSDNKICDHMSVLSLSANIFCTPGLVSEQKRYDSKCRADLYLETKVLKTVRSVVGIHDGMVIIEEIDPGDVYIFKS
jgi:hypothetical protein